jgi:hypothetical protein
MAKGQQRSNREKKKPKQAKKPAQATAYAATPVSPSTALPGKKK